MDGRDTTASLVNIEIFLDNKIFKDEVPKLRSKWNIPESGFSDFDTYNTWYTSQLTSRRIDNTNEIIYSINAPTLENDIDQLLDKMDYAPEWRRVAYEHIVFNQVLHKSPVILRSNNQIPHKTPIITHDDHQITLTIFPSTNSKEQADAILKINKLKKKLIGHRRETGKKNISRDKEIANQVDQEGSINAALDILANKDNPIIIENETARLAVKRLKKATGQQ